MLSVSGKSPGLKSIMPTANLVLTTIFDPVILDVYRQNLERYGHLDDVEVIVIPDRKTPAAAFETCALMARRGLKVVCPTLAEQEAFLERIGLDPEVVPYNSDNRRNLGFLMSLERHADFLISIDDDNYCRGEEDYFAAHADVLCGRPQHTIARSETRFLNICDLLEINGTSVYPRGYPYFARHQDGKVHTAAGAADVMINAGLWLNDPDVDAITWLGLRPFVRSFRDQSLVLDPGTWSPVNSQNTALRQDLIPAYYFIRMGYSLGGSSVDRYGDIFSGYFALACAKHLGGTARFGTPIADHRRNSHNYLKDASAEWPAIVLLEDLLGWLVEARLTGSTCLEAYLSLSYEIEEAVEKFHGPAWTGASRGFFHQMGYLMRAWLSACRTLAGARTAHEYFGSCDEYIGSHDGLLGDGFAARVRGADRDAIAAMAARDPDRSASPVQPGMPVAV
jgi:hypothetical protein